MKHALVGEHAFPLTWSDCKKTRVTFGGSGGMGDDKVKQAVTHQGTNPARRERANHSTTVAIEAGFHR